MTGFSLRMRIFSIRIFWIFLVCLLVIPQCSKSEKKDQSVPDQTIRVGIVLPLTGPQAKFGEIERKSFELALEEINSSGGIKGKELAFLFEDDTGRPDVGRSVVEKLITKDKVVMLGGGYSSSVTYAVCGVCQQNRVPFLVNTGSADNITEQGWEYIFRLNPPVSEYADGLADFLSSVVKGKTAVILYENTLFGSKGAEAFKRSCEKLGIKILTSEGYEHGNIDFKPVLVRIKKLDPDIVYMISYIMDATLLMRQSMELKLTPRLFAGAGAGFTLPEFYKNTGKAGEKVVSATLWHQVLQLEGAMDYFKKFQTRYRMETEYHGAEAYAAAYVIADVLKRSVSLSPDQIQQSLAQTDMMTVFGPVKFVSYGKKSNQNKLSSYVVQWQGGELKLIWPENLANSRYVFPVNWLKEWGYQE